MEKEGRVVVLHPVTAQFFLWFRFNTFIRSSLRSFACSAPLRCSS